MQRRGKWYWVVAAFVLIAVALIGMQIWGAFALRSVVMSSQRQIGKATTVDVARDKARQDLLAALIENQSKGIVQSVVAAQFGALAAALFTISGGIVALLTYMQSREKDRQDRLASSLSEALTLLVSDEPRQRMVGAAALTPFFAEDREDFHLQALTALVAAARATDERPEVRQSIRLVFERALAANPDLVRRVSLQGVVLPSLALENAALPGADFRDADLQNARLSGAVLDGANFAASKLQGSDFSGASLQRANLAYGDFAGATLARAKLCGATLSGIKVLNADLADADFTSIGEGWRGVPWDAARNGRLARFDPAVRQELNGRYGAEAPHKRVLMLLWEVPPLVAGGTWTACYHMVRSLHRRGADITVVVPWDRDAIAPQPFDMEIPIVGLGMKPPAAAGGAYGPYRYSSYSSYYRAGPYSVYGSYTPSLVDSTLYRLIGEFKDRCVSYVREHRVDLIHAHDWVTFDAARAASDSANVPWIAHFHSTEEERQLDNADPITQRIEQSAVDSASRIVAPSAVTHDALRRAYHARDSVLDVVPNMLSDASVSSAEMGRFETRRVTFVGRLTPQKGVDIFCDVVERLRQNGVQADFQAYGDGEERWRLKQHGIADNGALDWEERGRAYRGASVVVVPSRAEPFGMVILEAMQHRVPVVYPSDAGAAEVLQRGVRVRSSDVNGIAAGVAHLLEGIATWEAAVNEQAVEIAAYPQRDFDDRLLRVWAQVPAQTA